MNRNVTLVGLTGRKRSGKDTAGAVFQEAGYVRLAFATPIKIMIGVLLQYQGITEPMLSRMMEGDLKEEPSDLLGGKSPRHAMQTLGTEWGRGMISDSLWVDTLLKASKRFEQVVVTDVRFPNEVTAVKEAGGEIYRISRTGNVPPPDAHMSEALIDTLDVDQDIVNDAETAADFQIQVAKVFFTDGPSADFH